MEQKYHQLDKSIANKCNTFYLYMQNVWKKIKKV